MRTKRVRCSVTGKAYFRDSIAAKVRLDAIQRNHDSHRDKLPVRVYRCNHCHGWHLTSLGVRDATLPAA